MEYLEEKTYCPHCYNLTDDQAAELANKFEADLARENKGLVKMLMYDAAISALIVNKIAIL